MAPDNVAGFVSTFAPAPCRTRPRVSRRRPSARSGAWRTRPHACAAAEGSGAAGTRDPNEALDAAQLEAWAAVAGVVRGVAPALPADGVVAKAFGWGRLSQRFWRGDHVEEVPSVERVEASLEFLRGVPLRLSDAEIAGVLKTFPECLNLDGGERMQENMTLLGKSWPAFKDEKRLKAAVLDKPAILGFSVDCEGDCRSECNRCWARF